MPSAPGTVLASVQLPPGAVGSVLSADAAGGVAFTPLDAPGVTRLDAQLAQVYSVPYGDVVALDAAGNAYIAGGFTAPMDFGTGMIAPNGNVDTYLVKLSPTGEVLSARALDLCGDGVQAIAVGRDGRIAISGTAIGTAVLDASGAVVYQLAASGKVAFDSHGDLVLGGGYSGTLDLGGGIVLEGSPTDVDAYLAVFDPSGAVKLARRFGDTTLPVSVGNYNGFSQVTENQTQSIVDVAVGPHDSIVAAGAFRGEINLDGDQHVNAMIFPSGSEIGTFVYSLSADGNEHLGRTGFEANAGVRLGGYSEESNLLRPGNAVAVNANGAIVFSSNQPGNAQWPDAYPQLSAYDQATGASLVSVGNDFGPSGYGLGVAVDGCGNAIWASLENTPSLFDQHVFLRRIAL